MLREFSSREKKFGPLSSQLSDTLAALALLYADGRWDEYSVARVRMLHIFERSNPGHPGPVPGGPFPRIGLPGYTSTAQKPLSILSVWLNRKTLPELYADEQIGTETLGQQLKDQLQAAQKRNAASEETCRKMEKLAAFYCAMMRFTEAEPLFVSALETREKLSGKKPESLLPDLDNLARIYSIAGDKSMLQKIEARAQAIRRRPAAEKSRG